MIRINLLPYRVARKKENVRIQVNIFIGSVAILLGLAFLFNTHLGGKIKGLNSEIASTRDQVAKYQAINKEIAEIKQKLALLERKIEVIGNLERDRKAPMQNLDALYKVLVEKRMWYTQIEEKGSSIKVSGIAIDNQTVADYMVKVDQSERFENVRLAAIKHHQLQGKEDLSLKQFDVNFQKEVAKKEAAEVKKP